MAEYHFPVPGQEIEGEKIIIFTRKHWIAFLGPLLIIFVLLIIPIIFFLIISFNTNIFQTFWINIIIIATSVYYLIILNFAFIELITFYYDIYIITDKKIIDIVQNGIFNRAISELPILRIQNATSEIKGFLPTFFGYGNVKIETAGEYGETFTFENVPNPVEITAKIMSLQEKTIAQESRESGIRQAEGILERQIKPAAEQEPAQKPENIKKSDFEGGIDKDQLDKGGEIKL